MRVKCEIHNVFTLRKNISPMTIRLQFEEIQSGFTSPTISEKKKNTHMFLLIISNDYKLEV